MATTRKSLLLSICMPTQLLQEIILNDNKFISLWTSFQRAFIKVRSLYTGFPPKSTTVKCLSSTWLSLYYRHFVEILTEKIHLKRVFWIIPAVKYN